MGKFFLDSHLPGPQLPRLGSTCNLPLPSRLLCFGLCPSFPRPPLRSLSPVPPHSLVFLSPLPLCNSLPAPSASPSWLSARNVGWGRPNPLLAEEGDEEVATKTPTSPGQPPAVPPRPCWSVGPRLSCYKLPTGQHPRSRLSVPHLPSRQAPRLTCSPG